MLPSDYCVDMFETCLEFTISMPVWGLPLLILIVVGGLISLGFMIRCLRSRIQQLSNQLEDLQKCLENYKAQEKIWHSSREAYYNFIDTVSHDMGTPLQSIQTTLDNMRSYVLLEGGQRQQHHGIMMVQVRRLSNLLENLKLLSRLEAPSRPLERQPINLRDLIEDIFVDLLSTAEETIVKLSYDCPQELPLVFGNRDGLYWVFVNLVQNGIKYAKAGGGEVCIRVNEISDRLWVHVEDDGIGIAEDALPYIFDTAYRSPDVQSFRRKGSGLGLAITKRIVEQHQGTIKAQSQLAEGTTFIFDLPIYIPHSSQ